jgi:N,N-dimethylformamidase
MAYTITRFRYLFGDDRSIYAITAAGTLLWYPVWTDSSNPPSVDQGRQIGIGWADFSHVFSGGDGIVYAVDKDGALRWYRDERRDGTNAADGSTGWASASGNQIGTGWLGFAQLFSGSDGVIYAVRTTGELLWYSDLARDGSNAPDGSAGWAETSGSQIGVGWNGFRHIVPGGGGVIYAVTLKGDLTWYRDDRRDGSNDSSGAEGWAAASGARIGIGWDFFSHLFAGEEGVIIACRAAEFGGTLLRYRDLLRDGTNGPGGGWLTSATTASSGWQIAATEGYCWPIGASPGEAIRFHVSSSTPGAATVSYVRLGGRGPRLGVVLMEGPAFDIDFEANGTWSADCAWPEAFSLELPTSSAPWEPGFYAARVKGLSGPPFEVPFIVRRGVTTAPIALIVNVNTWNAYNTWGGASNYTATASPINLAMKHPNHHLLTYSQDHARGSHMLRSEIWLHSWLKSEGYQVDLFTDIDLEAGIENLAEYKALILSTHPEYWTQTMMARATAFLDAGRSLLYLGGNGMYRPTILAAENPGSGDLDLMTSESTQWSSYPTYEGQPLFAARVDALGGPGPGIGLAISDPQHRFMPTGVVAGQVVGASGWNGSPETPFGASGWETDHWSAPLPDAVSELARDPGSDGAVLACYDTSSGGFVLGAASLTFVGALMQDRVLQEIVRNALSEALAKP